MTDYNQLCSWKVSHKPKVKYVACKCVKTQQRQLHGQKYYHFASQLSKQCCAKTICQNRFFSFEVISPFCVDSIQLRTVCKETTKHLSD
jgi:hypothetical protein